jgi:hypothetical protein
MLDAETDDVMRRGCHLIVTSTCRLRDIVIAGQDSIEWRMRRAFTDIGLNHASPSQYSKRIGAPFVGEAWAVS